MLDFTIEEDAVQKVSRPSNTSINVLCSKRNHHMKSEIVATHYCDNQHIS